MLVLLADTRKKLLWLWIAGTAVLASLVFVQTLAGKFEEIEGAAWSWVFMNLLPAFLLLFVAVLLNKNPSKVLYHATFQAVYMGGVTYLLLVLATLIALPFATRNESIEVYLQMSYFWLVPFQGLLVVVFGLLYFRKEAFFRPNATIMQAYVGKKGEFAKRTGNLSQSRAFDLLTQEDGLGKALEFLSALGGDDLNDVILMQNQYARWKQGRDLNTESPELLQRELNRMTLAVVDIIEKV
jgi:hypothetical protein